MSRENQRNGRGRGGMEGRLKKKGKGKEVERSER